MSRLSPDFILTLYLSYILNKELIINIYQSMQEPDNVVPKQTQSLKEEYEKGVIVMDQSLNYTRQTLEAFEANQLILEDKFRGLENFTRQNQKRFDQSFTNMQNRIKDTIEKSNAETSRNMQDFKEQMLKRFDQRQQDMKRDMNQHSTEIQKLYKIVEFQVKKIDSLSQRIEKTERKFGTQMVYLRESIELKAVQHKSLIKQSEKRNEQQFRDLDDKTNSYLQTQLNYDEKRISLKLRDIQHNFLTRIEALSEKIRRIQFA